jgi:SAM-dependent methyltransferase
METKEMLLNLLARSERVRNPLRRIRGVGRALDIESLAASTLDRLRVRREFIGDDRIRDAVLLEIGSGRNCGLAVLLLSLGARRLVNVEVDSYGFIARADFYRRLAELAAEQGLPISWPPRGILVDPDGRTIRHDPELITLHLGRSAESVPEPDGSIDLSFSVAVLEHVRREAMAPVARELHRLTRRGGIGYHRVDLVDHYTRNERPFRFLNFSERQYQRMFGNRGSSSNRMRMDEIEQTYRNAGFAGVWSEDIQRYPDKALFMRWQRDFHEDFRNRDPESLRAISFMLVARKD